MLELRILPRPLLEKLSLLANEKAFFLELSGDRVKRFVPVLLSFTINTLQGDVWTAATMSWELQNWQEACSAGAGQRDS